MSYQARIVGPFARLKLWEVVSPSTSAKNKSPRVSSWLCPPGCERGERGWSNRKKQKLTSICLRIFVSPVGFKGNLSTSDCLDFFARWGRWKELGRPSWRFLGKDCRGFLASQDVGPLTPLGGGQLVERRLGQGLLESFWFDVMSTRAHLPKADLFTFWFLCPPFFFKVPKGDHL